MERRSFLKFAFGIAAGAGAIAAAASAATAAPMLSPHHDLMNGPKSEPDVTAKPAVADQDDLARATPENVQWRRRHYRRHYRRRYRRHYRRW
jgi:hypothetical protein